VAVPHSEHDSSGPALKCKIDLVGPKACKFTAADGAEAEVPDFFKDREVEVAVLVRAFYKQKDTAGLIVDVVAMKLGELKTPEQPDWWALAAATS
jgi:hypothetical protein